VVENKIIRLNYLKMDFESIELLMYISNLSEEAIYLIEEWQFYFIWRIFRKDWHKWRCQALNLGQILEC